MIIQDRIDEVVMAVVGVLKDAAIPDGDKEWILEGVKELGFRWQASCATTRALTVVLGLMRGYYPGNLKNQFILECAELDLYDELAAKEKIGNEYLLQQISEKEYATLVDMLMVQQINCQAGVFISDAEKAANSADPDGDDRDSRADLTGKDRGGDADPADSGLKNGDADPDGTGEDDAEEDGAEADDLDDDGE